MKAFTVTPAPSVTLITDEVRGHLAALGVEPHREFIGFTSWSEVTTLEDGTSILNGPFLQFVRVDDEIECTTIGSRVAPRPLALP